MKILEAEVEDDEVIFIIQTGNKIEKRRLSDEGLGMFVRDTILKNSGYDKKGGVIVYRSKKEYDYIEDLLSNVDDGR